MGGCPCPRCLIKKADIAELGTTLDMQCRIILAQVDNYSRQNKINRVRQWIYERGRTLRSKCIEAYIGLESLVPTRVSTARPTAIVLLRYNQNAFSLRLSSYGFDFHSMLVPDLLHEFELGVWKAIFRHLLRILYAYGGSAILDLNIR